MKIKSSYKARCFRAASFSLKVFLLGSCWALVSGQAGAEPQPIASDLDMLRQEIADMRQAYEMRIAQLENKIQGLETRETALEQEAKRAELAAKKSEDCANSAENAKEETLLTRQEIENMFAEGERRPWAEVDTPGKPLEFHGSIRSGFGVNGRGGVQVPFQAPDSPAKYRLGNEPDTYAELVFDSQFFPYGKDTKPTDPTFRAVLSVDYGRDNSDLTEDSEFSVSQAYAEVGQLFRGNPSTKIWMGQRYYLDPNVYMNNFTYVDMSGYGGGVEDIDIGGIGKFSAAWIGGTIDKLNSDGTPADDKERFAKNDFVFSFYDFDVPYGKGQVWLDAAWAQEGVSPINGHFPDSQGIAGGFIHRIENLYGGSNQAAIQFGYGSASNFQSFLEAPTSKINDSWSFLVLDNFMIQPWDELSIMFMLAYEETDNGKDTDNRSSWISTGVRPVWHFTRELGIGFEGSVDYTDPFTGSAGELYKFTIAPQITPTWNFAVRPVLRVFFTYAIWSDSFKGRVGGDAYRRNTDGIAAGVQVEAAW